MDAKVLSGMMAALIALSPPLRPGADAEARKRNAPQCNVAGALVRVPELIEGSGVAISRHNPARGWAHNDSGDPVLFTLDARGVVEGRLQLTGVRVEDWESMGAAACASGSCLYVGDIGDNEADRDMITVYRVAEPDAANGTIDAVDVFRARYPDGPHDAETLLVTPDGDLFVVTKGETGPVTLYRFPREMKPGAAVELQQVARAGDGNRAGANDRITDGAVSPNGEWVALRTTADVRFHRAAELFAGKWREAGRVNLQSLGEPQGEGVAFVNDTTLVLVGEGGGKKQPGTYARLTCTF